MKTLFSLLIITCLAFSMHAQKEPSDFKFYVAAAQDVEMSYNGPHGDGGTLNLETSLGFEWDNIRIWTGVEWLTQINYLKYTYTAIDIKLIRLMDSRLVLSVGPEASIIYRFDMERQTDTGVDYILKAPAYLSYGGNAQIDFALTPTFGIFANTNVFKAEPFDNLGNTIDKEYRWDVRVGIKLVLFNRQT